MKGRSKLAADDEITDIIVKPPLWRRLLTGLPVFSLGILIAGYMGISVMLEIMTNDFFGMCVALLVVGSGIILAREGFFLLRGFRPARLNATPSDYHLAAYARVVGHPNGMPADPSRCAEVVYKEWQCPNPRGYGPQQAFCLKHAKARGETAP